MCAELYQHTTYYVDTEYTVYMLGHVYERVHFLEANGVACIPANRSITQLIVANQHYRVHHCPTAYCKKQRKLMELADLYRSRLRSGVATSPTHETAVPFSEDALVTGLWLASFATAMVLPTAQPARLCWPMQSIGASTISASLNLSERTLLARWTASLDQHGCKSSLPLRVRSARLLLYVCHGCATVYTVALTLWTTQLMAPCPSRAWPLQMPLSTPQRRTLAESLS